MKKYARIINSVIFRCKNINQKLLNNRKGFGMNEILGIAAAIVIAALIVLPGLKTFTGDIMEKLTTWWDGVQSVFFSTTP
ncbi:MAG TPA: hypothetical protein PK733_12465 [Clostridiales bacterium]|nr:hypothetical protein [Clostridiales bacterium]